LFLALVASLAVSRALARGWRGDGLLVFSGPSNAAAIEPARVVTWRIDFVDETAAARAPALG
jgi:hypothetical protein